MQKPEPGSVICRGPACGEGPSEPSSRIPNLILLPPFDLPQILPMGQAQLEPVDTIIHVGHRTRWRNGGTAGHLERQQEISTHIFKDNKHMHIIYF